MRTADNRYLNLGPIAGSVIGAFGWLLGTGFVAGDFKFLLFTMVAAIMISIGSTQLVPVSRHSMYLSVSYASAFAALYTTIAVTYLWTPRLQTAYDEHNSLPKLGPHECMYFVVGALLAFAIYNYWRSRKAW